MCRFEKSRSPNLAPEGLTVGWFTLLCQKTHFEQLKGWRLNEIERDRADIRKSFKNFQNDSNQIEEAKLKRRQNKPTRSLTFGQLNDESDEISMNSR